MCGLAAREFPLEDSLCGHALKADGPLLIPDLSQDPQFATARLAEAVHHVRSYASYPLHAPNGSRVGGLCVMDRAPRVFDHEMERTLRDLALLVETELQLSALTRAQSILTTDLDAVGRYGGEEFLVVIVEHEPQIIHSVAARIHHNISSAPVTADRLAPLC